MTSKVAIGIALLLLSGSAALAEKIVIWKGSADIQPCSRVEWNNNGFLGTPSPTTRVVRQIASASLYINVSTGSHDILMNLKQVAENCAVVAVGAAGLTAFATGGAGSWEAASAAFQGCMAAEPLYTYVINYGTDYDTSCDW